MAAKITKTWDKAGYLPGQKQKLTIEFKSRSGNTVYVNYTLDVKSLGNDRYYYSERHNEFHIFQPKSSIRVTRTYQLRGYPKNGTYTGSFNITNVGNTVTSLDFYYENKRIWVKHTNPGDPRSTGVVKKTHIGSLPIPANTLHSVTFKDIINNKEYKYSCYHDNNFTIPNLDLSSDKYTFEGWTTVDYTQGMTGYDIPNVTIEGIEPTIKTNNTVKITSNITYYSVWKPKICSYNFYWYDNSKILFQWPHKWGTFTTLPDLDKEIKYKDNNSAIVKSSFPYPGYNFSGWRAFSPTGLYYSPNSSCNEWNETGVDFYPEKTAKLNKIRFKIKDKNLPNNELLFDYYTDDNFEMRSPLDELNTSEIFIKPGYKLIGWITISPKVLQDRTKYKDILDNKEGIAFPNCGYNLYNLSFNGKYYENGELRVYPTNGKIVFNYDDFIEDDEFPYPYLNLYPYYEYYTTIYIYDNNEWKLAMPYIYDGDKWDMALSYIYDSNKWKL